ncbi:hypothetical protein [Clostridium chrysemydis]|uniref:hypothetical protein n=1 Tax=Clostridium chrysemydis TaxID=2665504 RepID=UPI00188386D8|nr:hypothetical protein [Clostridium chrysemydis]
MQIENLKEGQVIKNYKELCNILGKETKVGKSKQLQIKDFDRYFKYKKEGNKFIIEEIYQIAKEKVDKRLIGVYTEDLERIILRMCKKMNENENYSKIELSVSGMLMQLNMINANYNIGRYHMSKLSNYTRIPIDTVRDFYNNTSNNLRYAVERVLKQLQDRCLIKWSYIYKIQTCGGVYKEATDRDLFNIAESEREVLNEMNYSSKSQVISDGKYNNFNKMVLNYLEKSNIKKYYSAFKIITTYKFQEFLMDDKNELLELRLEDCKNRLNNNVIKNIINNAENRQRTAKSKKDNGVFLSAKDEVRALECFVSDIEQLTNICIQNLSSITDIVNLQEELSKVKAEAYTYQNKILDLWGIKEELFDILF